MPCGGVQSPAGMTHDSNSAAKQHIMLHGSHRVTNFVVWHRYLDWVSAADGLPRDGRWSCGTHDYPSMHHSLMHPCSDVDNNCCGNSRSAPFLLRYESFFHSQNALLVLAYEVGCQSAESTLSALLAPACASELAAKRRHIGGPSAWAWS